MKDYDIYDIPMDEYRWFPYDGTEEGANNIAKSVFEEDFMKYMNLDPKVLEMFNEGIITISDYDEDKIIPLTESKEHMELYERIRKEYGCYPYHGLKAKGYESPCFLCISSDDRDWARYIIISMAVPVRDFEFKADIYFIDNGELFDWRMEIKTTDSGVLYVPSQV